MIKETVPIQLKTSDIVPLNISDRQVNITQPNKKGLGNCQITTLPLSSRQILSQSVRFPLRLARE